ncbi:MAG: hypothetical protein ACI8WB_003151 [Phenylobacterium sp.]|jgi:hypothetical protein
MKKTLCALSLILASTSALAVETEVVTSADLDASFVQDVRENLENISVEKFDTAMNLGLSMMILYKDSHYRGSYRVILGDTTSLRISADFNDAASSVKIINASGAILYKDDYYKGSYRVVLGDESDFRNINFNDDLSSLKFLNF